MNNNTCIPEGESYRRSLKRYYRELEKRARKGESMEALVVADAALRLCMQAESPTREAIFVREVLLSRNAARGVAA